MPVDRIIEMYPVTAEPVACRVIVKFSAEYLARIAGGQLDGAAYIDMNGQIAVPAIVMLPPGHDFRSGEHVEVGIATGVAIIPTGIQHGKRLT